jgi:hypothetical protein
LVSQALIVLNQGHWNLFCKINHEPHLKMFSRHCGIPIFRQPKPPLSSIPIKLNVKWSNWRKKISDQRKKLGWSFPWRCDWVPNSFKIKGLNIYLWFNFSPHFSNCFKSLKFLLALPNLASLVFLFQNHKNFSQNQLKKTIKLDLNLTQFKRKKLKSQTNLSDKKKRTKTCRTNTIYNKNMS